MLTINRDLINCTKILRNFYDKISFSFTLSLFKHILFHFSLKNIDFEIKPTQKIKNQKQKFLVHQVSWSAIHWHTRWIGAPVSGAPSGFVPSSSIFDFMCFLYYFHLKKNRYFLYKKDVSEKAFRESQEENKILS